SKSSRIYVDEYVFFDDKTFISAPVLIPSISSPYCTALSQLGQQFN
ncbi:MAG: hypothetical protein ACI96N_003258, partial [Arenicella sp.]